MHLDISKGDMILVGGEIPFSNAIETAKDGVCCFDQTAEALRKRTDACCDRRVGNQLRRTLRKAVGYSLAPRTT